MRRNRKPPFLERALWKAVLEFNRTGWTSNRLEFLRRDPNRFYAEDGLWTHHRHPFVDDSRFQRAYARAVRAGGFDYKIRWRTHTLLWAAEAARRLEGAFVECGTGRGFMASAICEYLDWDERPFYLFDTFKPNVLDSEGRQLASEATSPYYATDVDAVAENLAEWPSVDLVVGEVPASLGEREIDQVAFLHLDMNHGPTEEAAVRHFWPRMTPGGLMVFDDYGLQGYESSGESAALLASELGFSVLTSATGQGVVIKG